MYITVLDYNSTSVKIFHSYNGYDKMDMTIQNICKENGLNDDECLFFPTEEYPTIDESLMMDSEPIRHYCVLLNKENRKVKVVFLPLTSDEMSKLSESSLQELNKICDRFGFNSNFTEYMISDSEIELIEEE